MGRVRRQLEEAKARYYGEGLGAIDGQCPYPTTSFAALHWRRGAAERGERA